MTLARINMLKRKKVHQSINTNPSLQDIFKEKSTLSPEQLNSVEFQNFMAKAWETATKNPLRYIPAYLLNFSITCDPAKTLDIETITYILYCNFFQKHFDFFYSGNSNPDNCTNLSNAQLIQRFEFVAQYGCAFFLIYQNYLALINYAPILTHKHQVFFEYFSHHAICLAELINKKRSDLEYLPLELVLFQILILNFKYKRKNSKNLASKDPDNVKEDKTKLFIKEYENNVGQLLYMLEKTKAYVNHDKVIEVTNTLKEFSVYSILQTYHQLTKTIFKYVPWCPPEPAPPNY